MSSSRLQTHPELWQHFVRAEEYVSGLRDCFGRFPYYCSTSRSIFDPSVSRWLVDQGLRPNYPNGKRYAICLTHDIDGVYQRRFDICKQIARAVSGGRFKQASAWALPLFLRRRNPLWNFELIQELECRHGAKSSFYFLALRKDEPDFNYELRDLRPVLRNLNNSGWEIGLHGGHEAYLDREKMREEKARLEDVLGAEVVGYRNHFLRFHVPNTWRLLEQLGFTYDTTFGFADCVGFRNGVCHPFRPFDLEQDRFLNIIELPLTLMDCALERYMRLDWETGWKLTKSLLDITASLAGVLTVVWHNSYMQGDSLKFYERLLEHGQETGAWMAPAAAVANWWQVEGYDKVLTSE